MTCGIYKIHDTHNGQVYIGQSIDIEHRWYQHKTNPSSSVEDLVKSKFVSFEIVKEIDAAQYTEEELHFILDIWEDHILRNHGGISSKKVLNKKNIYIRPVPLTILRYELPSFLDRYDLYYAIKEYNKKDSEIIRENNYLTEANEWLQSQVDELTDQNRVLKFSKRSLTEKIESLKEYNNRLIKDLHTAFVYPKEESTINVSEKIAYENKIKELNEIIKTQSNDIEDLMYQLEGISNSEYKYHEFEEHLRHLAIA